MSVDVSKDLVRDVILQTTTPDIRVADEVFRNEPPYLGENGYRS